MIFNDIHPQVQNKINGPFGRLYDDDEGFSHEEWSSIPPITWEMRGMTIKELNLLVEEALKSLLLECDFQLLTTNQKQVVSILYSGYKCTEWVSINADEEKAVIHDCTDLAIENWLNQTNKKYWKRLNWDVIETSFEKRSEEWIAEEEKWAKSVGVTFKKNWQYIKPKASWSYWGDGYYGASWSVRIGQ